MELGKYIAIAKENFSLEDSPACWIKGNEYECYLKEDTILIAPEQGGNIHFSINILEDIKDCFEFIKIED